MALLPPCPMFLNLRSVTGVCLLHLRTGGTGEQEQQQNKEAEQGVGQRQGSHIRELGVPFWRTAHNKPVAWKRGGRRPRPLAGREHRGGPLGVLAMPPRLVVVVAGWAPPNSGLPGDLETRQEAVLARQLPKRLDVVGGEELGNDLLLHRALGIV